MKNIKQKQSQKDQIKSPKKREKEQQKQIQIKNKKQSNVRQVLSNNTQCIISKESILEQFKQFGLETIIVDDSFQNILDNKIYHTSNHLSRNQSQMHNQHHHYNNNLTHNIYQESKHIQPYTNNQHINSNKYNKKLQQLKTYINNIKTLLKNILNQISQQLKNVKDENQKKFTQLLIYLQKKFNFIIQVNHQQKQLLKHQIYSLKINIDNINQQNKYLNQKIKLSNLQYKQIQQIKNLDIPTQNVKICQEVSKQYQKHTQALRQLNKQMLVLNKQIQFLTQENKRLKKLISQYDQKFKDQSIQTRNLQQKNAQSYSMFLSKVENLQKQIKSLKKNQNIKDKPQLTIKFNQIAQFSQGYQQKTKQTAFGQKPLQQHEKQLHRQLSLQHNDFLHTYSNDEQPRSKLTIPIEDIESPISKKSARQGWVGTHDEFCSEKLIKLSRTPMSRSSLHARQSFLISQDSLDKSIPKRTLKYADQISCRIMKIQCSIANQLNALRYGK